MDNDIAQEILQRLTRTETKVDGLIKSIDGNGKPGLWDEFRQVRETQSRCQEVHKAEAAMKVKQEKKFLTIATVLCGVVGAVAPYIFRFVGAFLMIAP